MTVCAVTACTMRGEPTLAHILAIGTAEVELRPGEHQ